MSQFDFYCRNNHSRNRRGEGAQITIPVYTPSTYTTSFSHYQIWNKLRQVKLKPLCQNVPFIFFLFNTPTWGGGCYHFDLQLFCTTHSPQAWHQTPGLTKAATHASIISIAQSSNNDTILTLTAALRPRFKLGFWMEDRGQVPKALPMQLIVAFTHHYFI